ncbi:MAG: aminotransferase class IV [Chloroflexota bacterium]
MEGGLIYLNGRMLEERGLHLSALDRGFTLGDGAFDTLRAVEGRVYRLPDHIERLKRSATALELPLPLGDSELGEVVYAVLAANGLGDALIRITLTRGVPAVRGLLPPSSPSPTVAIHAVPFEGYPEEGYRRGYTAILSTIRRNETSPLSYIKSCNYLDSVLARMQAGRQGCDEAIMLNCAGQLACGSSSNLFLVSEEGLITPSLDGGVLAGVTRRTVIELAAEAGTGCSERPTSPRELFAAQEAFVTNSALGLMPLVAVDGGAIGSGAPGPVTLRLRAAYERLLRAAGQP